jgi:hypothetical protein
MRRKGPSMSASAVAWALALVLLGGTNASATTQGIPFGPNDLPASLYGKPYTGTKILIIPARAVQRLEKARAAGMRVILKLAGDQDNYQNADGSFNLTMWEAAIDAFRDVDFAPFVADGTIVAHQLVSEAKAPDQWGGTIIPNDVLDTMAAYSKSIWPTMPTLVRADAGDLEEDAAGYQQQYPDGWTWQYLDAASSRYSARKGDAATFAVDEQAAADRQGLALAIGMNVLSGGDGSSGFPSPEKAGAWAMSGHELKRYTRALLANSRGCAFEMWKYFSTTTYFRRRAVVRAMKAIAVRAAAYPSYPCTRTA